MATPEPCSLYRDPAHYDLLAQMTAPADLAFHCRHLGAAATLLELGCGTGRLTIPLAERIADVLGVDHAPAMVAHARAKADAAASRARFAEGDFLTLALGRRFDRLLLAYNTLNHVIVPEELAALFESVRRHLAPGGRLVVDTFNPDPAALGRPPVRTRLLRYRDPTRGEIVELYEESAYDAARQVSRVTLSCDIDGRLRAREHEIAMRIFFPQELDLLFAHHGFAIDAKYGDYDDGPFGSRSPKQLVIAHAR